MKHWLIGSVAAAALLAACGGGDKTEAPSSATEAVQVGDVKLAGLQLTPGDASKVGDALAALSLSESGAGRVSFADSSTSGADATFNNIAVSIEEGESPITAGSLVFKGLDMTDAGASFSQMTLNDISIAPDDGEDAEVKISSVQLTNPSPELGAWVASLMGEGEPAAFPAFENISFDGLSLGGMNVVADGVDELETFKIGAIDVRELSSTGIGSMVLEGVDLQATDDGQAIKFSLGSMGVAGLNETMMGAFAAGIAGGAADVDSEEMVSQIMELVSANPGDPGYDSFTMDSFAMDAAGLKIDLPSVEGAVTRDNQGRATRSVTKPFTMSVSADPEGEVGSQLAGPLSLMGYETLNFSAAGDIGINPDTDTYTSDSKDNYFALEDGFKLSFGGSYSGVADFYKGIAKGTENGASDDEAMLAALSALSIGGLDINFEDNSIVEKAFATAAAMTGQDAEGMRVQATAGTAMLPLLAGQAGVDPAMAAELGGALSKFLDESGTLSIKLAPETPLTAADFQDPTALTKDRLGFSAETK